MDVYVLTILEPRTASNAFFHQPSVQVFISTKNPGSLKVRRGTNKQKIHTLIGRLKKHTLNGRYLGLSNQKDSAEDSDMAKVIYTTAQVPRHRPSHGYSVDGRGL